ncbi:MAG: helix-turn-helix transcriptional regulator [Methanocalculaceae archaeon]|jgi:DNA-binding HxlR family transcriptional regulator|nr:helix-turn-helix transcriptional regulator [Methanocalculaceae archaeon]
MTSRIKTKDPVACPVYRAQKIISGKWKVCLLCLLNYGTKRFSDLYRNTTGITQAMLTKQLRELEDDGFVSRCVYPEIPPKVEYSLTELGESFMPILQKISEWSETHLQPKANEIHMPCCSYKKE